MAKIVVTGASTGIGRAAVERLAGGGHTVFAGVRKQEDAKRLVSEIPGSVVPIILDVTDEVTVSAAVKVVAEQVGEAGLDGLVNNAGIGIAGAMEHVRIDDLRRQLEVNVVAQVVVTQAFMPLIRKARGRIVFTGSMAGRVPLSTFGPYTASKFAIEGLAGSMRAELKPWGIRVSVIEPGAIDTPIWDKNISEVDEIRAAMTPEQQARYAEHLKGAERFIAHSEQIAIPADRVARAMEKALFSRRPKARYPVGLDARAGALGSRFLPDWLNDTVTAKFSQTALPRSLE